MYVYICTVYIIYTNNIKQPKKKCSHPSWKLTKELRSVSTTLGRSPPWRHRAEQRCSWAHCNWRTLVPRPRPYHNVPRYHKQLQILEPSKCWQSLEAKVLIMIRSVNAFAFAPHLCLVKGTKGGIFGLQFVQNIPASKAWRSKMSIPEAFSIFAFCCSRWIFFSATMTKWKSSCRGLLTNKSWHRSETPYLAKFASLQKRFVVWWLGIDVLRFPKKYVSISDVPSFNFSLFLAFFIFRFHGSLCWHSKRRAAGRNAMHPCLDALNTTAEAHISGANPQGFGRWNVAKFSLRVIRSWWRLQNRKRDEDCIWGIFCVWRFPAARVLKTQPTPGIQLMSW